MRKKLFIFGGGGLGREVLSMMRYLEDWDPAGFIDDNLKKGTMISGLEVKGDASFLAGNDLVNVVIAIGNPLVKAKIVERITNGRINFPALIHPAVILQNMETINIGRGCIIAAGCILTTDITLGDH